MTECNINLFSVYLHGPVNVTVLLPSPDPSDASPAALYQSGARYPVLWLLHAGNGDRNDWARYTSLYRLMANRKAIVVMPDGLNSDFYDQPQFGEGYAYGDFFFKELMPFVQGWLPALDAREDNCLAGVSMGAMAVWTLALAQPERFGKIAPLSALPRNYGYLEQYRAMSGGAFRALAEKDRTAFPAGFGNPRNGIWPKEINMICKYPTVGDFLDSQENTGPRFRFRAERKELPQTIFMLGGEEDAGFADFLKEAEELHVRVRAQRSPGRGGHGFEYWDGYLPAMLEAFGL